LIIKYKETSATGNAGEYYFAYWISKYFQWPCRLLDIDLGIDAQIEILDKNNHTSGNFLAIQIKTTETTKENVSIELKNLEYWKTMDDIVILVSITLNPKPLIYWKVINDENIEKYILDAKSNDSNTTTIEFNNKNLLDKECKNIFALLPYKGSISQINLNIEHILDTCEIINSMLWNEDNQDYSWHNNFDLDAFETVMIKFDYVANEFENFEKIINKYSNIKTVLDNIDEVYDVYQEIKKNLKSLVWELFDNDSELKYESQKLYRTTDNHIEIIRLVESKY
jgi:hypothetical protein